MRVRGGWCQAAEGGLAGVGRGRATARGRLLLGMDDQLGSGDGSREQPAAEAAPHGRRRRLPVQQCVHPALRRDLVSAATATATV